MAWSKSLLSKAYLNINRDNVSFMDVTASALFSMTGTSIFGLVHVRKIKLKKIKNYKNESLYLTSTNSRAVS